jgi:hypothetical protein
MPPILLLRKPGTSNCWGFPDKATDALKAKWLRLNRHFALAYCLSMIFSENRCPPSD